MRTDWRYRIFNLTSKFQNCGHDVISRGEVLPPGECTYSICPASMLQCLPVPDL